MQMGNADLTQHLLHNNAYAPKVPQLQHRGGSDHNPGSSFDAASGSDSRQVPKPIPVPDTGRQDPPPEVPIPEEDPRPKRRKPFGFQYCVIVRIEHICNTSTGDIYIYIYITT